VNRLVLLLTQRLRRDALQLTLWIVGTALLALMAYRGVTGSYGTEQDRTALLATAVANPVILLFRGLPSGPDEGAFLAFLILPFLAMLAAFMSSFPAVRHTRTDEELGRAELVSATPAGRTLPLLATVLHGVLANLVLAFLVSLALMATGLEGSGAVVAGLATGGVGVSFLAIGVLGAQVVRTSRAANSIGVWAIVAAYLACGIGNAAGTPSADAQRIESGWLSWISPFGWAENTRPYDTNDVRPLLLCLALAIVAGAAAVALQATRDVGESLLHERSGRATAGAALGGPVGLAWRLSRGALLGWAIGGFVIGILATRLADILDSVSTEVPAVEQLSSAMAAGGSLAQATVVIFFTMLGVIAAGSGVQTLCRARQEEARGTAEPVLSAAVGRVKWLSVYLTIAVVGILATAAAGAAGAAVGLASLADPDWSLLDDVFVTGAGQAVAAGVFLVATTLVFVLFPRLTIPIGWTLVLVGMILGLFGPLFGFPDGVVDLSPIAVAPTVTNDGVDVRGLWWLVLAIAVGGAASLALMRRRELAGDG
jgi:ABC-2 type transport system permease protein